MIGSKTVIAVVPARGGSKGLPGKNIREICGKPLIAWTIEKALKSLYVDVLLVTTDREDIAAISRSYGAKVPFIRPAELATDHASTCNVIRHALAYYRDFEHREFDYTVLLEPTSPLREDGDVDRMLQKLEALSAEMDAIVSVGEVTGHPSIMKRFADGRIVPFIEGLVSEGRRQDNPPAYFPFGVAYIAKTAVLLQENTFYTRRCGGFAIKRYQNYEIDDIYDFICVESVMKYEWGLA
jgi:CMP-N,N'-diacetyllegionaminic acid synthase